MNCCLCADTKSHPVSAQGLAEAGSVPQEAMAEEEEEDDGDDDGQDEDEDDEDSDEDDDEEAREADEGAGFRLPLLFLHA